MKYKVEITEYLQRTISIEADNEDDALDKIEEAYCNEKIVLSADDFIDKEIKVLKD